MAVSTNNMDHQNNKYTPQHVRSLYTYEYFDAGRHVWMEEGELFCLLNGEDSAEWWHVYRPDDPHNTFYVPSSYVLIQEDGNVNTIDMNSASPGHDTNDINYNHNTHNTQLNHTNSYDGSTGKLGTFGSSQIQMEPQEGSKDYINVDMKPYSTTSSSLSDNKESFKVQYLPAKKPSDLQDINDEGDYANLDEFRAAINLPSLNQQLPQSPPSPQTPEGDYANLGELNMGEQSPPPLESCEYKKTLLDTWDMYLDPHTNRIFYVHKETKETQWKPPRGQYHQQMKMQRSRSRSSGEYEDVGDIISPLTVTINRPKSRSVDYGIPRVPLLKGALPYGWIHRINTIGEDVFVDRETQEERDGSLNSPTKSPTSEQGEKPFTKPDSPTSQGLPVQGLSQGPAPGPSQGLVQGPRQGAQVSNRFQKSRSVMLENLNLGSRYQTSAGPPPPKSATLPPNFSTPTFETQENQGVRKSSQPELFTQSVQLNEPIEGMLNRCKLVNGKKGSKKWALSYAKLAGTNLVFYKDQKSSQPKSGAPHGKSEQMLALRDCSLEKDPKDVGSKKKNMILINSPDGQIILQSDDDIKIQEWYLKLTMKIQELGGNPDAEAVDTAKELLTPDTHPALSKKPSFKGRHGRNPSDGGSSPLERKGRIKDVLTNFMKNRSEKKDLVKKGIYKDAVFGADLKLICEREKTKVPCFVTRAIEAIEKRGLDHEGMYRIGGNISSIQKLRCMVDQGEKYDLNDQMWDINILCGTLKLLFRELKEPLFTYALFDKFLKSFLKEVASERLKAMKATINELPKCHYETVKVLFKHLNNVMDHSSENKMQAHQLAIVFGPTLIWPEIQSQNLATSMVYQSRIVEFVLLEYNQIFR